MIHSMVYLKKEHVNIETLLVIMFDETGLKEQHELRKERKYQREAHKKTSLKLTTKSVFITYSCREFCMDSLFFLISYTPSLIVLLSNGALMYDTKDCNHILHSEGPITHGHFQKRREV